MDFSQKSYQKRPILILWKEKNDFKRKKIEVLKRAKKWNFPKGLVHRLCQKIKLSLIAVCYRNYARKDRFPIFMKENNHFWTKKLKF